MKVKVVRDDLVEQKITEHEFQKSLTVSELLDELGVEKQEVLVAREGQIISESHEVRDGDELNVFDVVAGG